MDAKLQWDRRDKTGRHSGGRTVGFLQSGEIRDPSKVRTQGSISSHLEKRRKEDRKRRKGGGVMFYFCVQMLRGVAC